MHRAHKAAPVARPAGGMPGAYRTVWAYNKRGAALGPPQAKTNTGDLDLMHRQFFDLSGVVVL